MPINKSVTFKNFGEITSPLEVLSAADLMNILGFIRGYGIISGCDISRSTNQITIASGNVAVAGTNVSFAGGAKTVDDTGMVSGQYRWSVLSIDSGGTLNITNGTPATVGNQVDKPYISDEMMICAALKIHGTDLTDERVIPMAVDMGANIYEGMIDHDQLANFVAAEHVSLPNTTANVLNDLLDEDNMSSNSATQPASQQSIKAYVDSSVSLSGSIIEFWLPMFPDKANYVDSAESGEEWGGGNDRYIYHDGGATAMSLYWDFSKYVPHVMAGYSVKVTSIKAYFWDTTTATLSLQRRDVPDGVSSPNRGHTTVATDTTVSSGILELSPNHTLVDTESYTLGISNVANGLNDRLVGLYVKVELV